MSQQPSECYTVTVEGGKGGPGGPGSQQGGNGGPGLGATLNFNAETIHIIINHANREEGIDISRLDFLNWLSPINFFLQQADISQVRVKGTGEWLLVHPLFQQWESGSGRTLWCCGIPGAGKTVLMSMVVDHLSVACRNNKDTGVACIYLNHKEAKDQTPSKLLAALWRQLVHSRDVGIIAKKLYQQHREKGTAPLLDEVVHMLSSSLKEFSKVFVVVDAIDEYPEFEQHILLQHLAAIGSNVNLMISSRPHISPDPSLFTNLETLHIRATPRDIQEYINAQIYSSPRLFEHVKAQSTLQGEIHAKIIDAVDGMFLLAKLHIESIRTKNTIKAGEEYMGSALHAAVTKGHTEIVHILVEKGADINTAGREWGSLLHSAAYLGHTEIVSILIEKGAKVNAAGGPYGSVLHTAVGKGHTEIVRILIESGADINTARREWGRSLHTAAYLGHTKIVCLFFENGADVNAAGGCYGSPLQAAAYGGNTEIVSVLLEKGAKINAAGGSYGSALHIAITKGHTDIVCILVEKGCQCQCSRGGT
ncbi:ANK-REP-REGION domain-containing protein [Mycena venus]|uniref:ANK-REP-REGION domain-containing protein n=1 Tax=Mycena venus TaxID=2733690 RepID=A0A8H6YC14_9AGAR|nr:ANK-REP-REGION domain-containing protein [Mycena venus]